MTGRAPGHCRVLCQIGSGGMGVVCPARDERLERDVLALRSEVALAVALAQTRAACDFDWPAAERGFQRAIELNPGEVTAHRNHGYLLLVNGRFAEAGRELRRGGNSTLSRRSRRR